MHFTDVIVRRPYFYYYIIIATLYYYVVHNSAKLIGSKIICLARMLILITYPCGIVIVVFVHLQVTTKGYNIVLL